MGGNGEFLEDIRCVFWIQPLGCSGTAGEGQPGLGSYPLAFSWVVGGVSLEWGKGFVVSRPVVSKLDVVLANPVP